MTGKQKCKILKEIRRQIAEKNDIRIVIEECTHQGKCRGTCPKCEWEVRMLERELEKRRAAGKRVALAGISAGFLLTSCSPIETIKNIFQPVLQPLEGEIPDPAATDDTTETGQEEYFVTEGEPAVEYETELGITQPDEPTAETETCTISEETDEEVPMIAGIIAPPDMETELVLEGDIRYTEPEDGETP